MNDPRRTTWTASPSSWVRSVGAAVLPSRGGFKRSLLPNAEDDLSATGTRNVARLRAWLYRDVHVRPADPVAHNLGYSQVPISDKLRTETVDGLGWRPAADRLVHDESPLILSSLAHHSDGFRWKDGVIALPRVRCGTSPGWLTVAGRTGQPSRAAHRLYLPGIDLSRVENVVDVLDGIPRPLHWSLKSSVGVSKEGREVLRTDRTVVYVEVRDPRDKDALAILFDELSSCSRDSPGPGFSLKVRPGVFLGGPGNDHGSHGTHVAHLAAEALLCDDPAPIEEAEARLRDWAENLGAAG